MSFRTTLIIVNLTAMALLGAVVIWRVLSLRRNPEPREPMNLAPELPDDVLEGRRLERVLGWALFMLAITVVSLFVYFLVEPFRETKMADAFQERAVERGAVLFANSASKNYESTKSLLCANCHGVDGGGGSATYVIQSDNPECKLDANKARADCLPVQVSWAAPSLQRAALLYDETQLTQIITYGRPGTPMPPWGVASGRGALNEQGISDLVAYVESLKKSAASAKADSAAAVANFRIDNGGKAVTAAQQAVTTAQDKLDAAKADLARLTSGGGTAREIQLAQIAVTAATSSLADTKTALETTTAFAARVQAMSEGEVLFRLNCARCHTKGASYFTAADQSLLPTGLFGPDAGGAYGPNLRDGDVLRQFPGGVGLEQQRAWVTDGVPAYQQYGVRGISSGRMPHFAAVLTKDQIGKIMDYERNQLG